MNGCPACLTECPCRPAVDDLKSRAFAPAHRYAPVMGHGAREVHRGIDGSPVRSGLFFLPGETSRGRGPGPRAPRGAAQGHPSRPHRHRERTWRASVACASCMLVLGDFFIFVHNHITHISPLVPHPTGPRTSFSRLREILIRLVGSAGPCLGSGTSCDANFTLARLRGAGV